MNPLDLFRRYQELQAYVGWNEADAARVQAVAPILQPVLPSLVDDFYEEIDRHPQARTVITGGQAQVARLKGSLLRWLHELLSGPYDRDYAVRRWRVGMRHVEIGLDQVYTNVALSRMRSGLIQALGESWQGSRDDLVATLKSLNRLIDLDLAKIEDAYQAEYLARQQRSDRLAAIGQVSGGIAHELRNPLNVVQTSVYYLLNARNLRPEKNIEHLRRIEQQVGVANGVITTLSNFAKMPVPNLIPFSAERCVKEALEINPVGDRIDVTIDFPSTLQKALGDHDQLRIVFANLIRNARDAMPQGGRLEIRGSSSEAVVEVSFEDSGVGIDPKNLNRIMEPLFSTKARGLGLGLALSRAILDKNKGSLQAASQLGKGSTFTVRLTADLQNRRETAP
jgi:signal transduction histidine kinase